MRAIENGNEMLVGSMASIREALKQIDNNSHGILFVVDEGRRLVGTVSDGDIRRSILAGKAITEPILGTYNPKPLYFTKEEFSHEHARTVLVERRLEVVPVVDEAHKVVGFVSWDDLLSGVERRPPGRSIDVPVVIMAGGKGTRMAPFTNVLPKPLIPIGEKTILELIIDSFRRYGVKDYFFTINYRGEMIRAYFDCIEKDYNITYLRETDFWGTAGSLSLLPASISKTFLVSNCDIIVNADYAEVLDFHRQSGALLTVLSSIQHHRVPYGVITFEAGGNVLAIEEKPEYTFCINTGVYILDSACLALIPRDEVFHMTHLMEKLMSMGKKVATYPVNESEYIDVGQWEEYHKAVEFLS